MTRQWRPPRDLIHSRGLTVTVDRSALSGPHLAMGSFTDGSDWVSFSWGQEGCDPAFAVEWRPTGWRRKPFVWLSEYRWRRTVRNLVASGSGYLDPAGIYPAYPHVGPDG